MGEGAPLGRGLGCCRLLSVDVVAAVWLASLCMAIVATIVQSRFHLGLFHTRSLSFYLRVAAAVRSTAVISFVYICPLSMLWVLRHIFLSCGSGSFTRLVLRGTQRGLRYTLQCCACPRTVSESLARCSKSPRLVLLRGEPFRTAKTFAEIRLTPTNTRTP